MNKEKYLEIQQVIESYGSKVVAKDFEHPCVAFLVIREDQAQDFANRFFGEFDVNGLQVEGKLSPKF